MNKVGRKKALSPEKVQEVRAKAEFYQRVKRECGPAALCRDYQISLTSLRTYTLGLHKRYADAPEVSQELTAEQVDTLLSRTLHQAPRASREAAVTQGSTSETGADAAQSEAPVAAVA